MNAEYQKYQLIEDYLNNKLSGAEVLEFENQLKSDPELQEELNDQKVANEVIIENRFFNIAANFQAPVPATEAPLLGVKTKIGIAITAGVAILGYFLYSKDNSSEIEKAEIKSPVVTSPVVENQNETSVKSENLVKESDLQTESIIEKATPTKEIEAVVSKDKIVETKKSFDLNIQDKDASYILEIPLEDNGQEAGGYNFDPESGEVWPIPVKANRNGDLKIFDKSGKEVFRTVITHGYPNSWKGISSSNAKLETGTYVYVLDYGNADVEHGYVSIVSHKTSDKK